MNEQLSLLLGLGPNAEWPYSEQSLVEIINLQREKEVTKQAYYRAENLNKSLELLNRCINANIPSYLIPIIFSGEALNEDLIGKLADSQRAGQSASLQIPQPHQPQQAQQSQQTQQTQQSHQSHQSQQTQHSQQIQHSPLVIPGPNTPYQSSNPTYSSYNHPVAPTHQSRNSSSYPSSHLAPPVSLYRTRPLSPAKIGAAAVSQLDRGRYPSSPVHRRNISLPVTSSFSTPPAMATSSGRLTRSPSLKGNSQQSMMNTIGSIQFVNENPGKKRRRSSQGQKDDQDQDSEESNDKENKKDITRINLNKGEQTPNSKIGDHIIGKSNLTENTPTAR